MIRDLLRGLAYAAFGVLIISSGIILAAALDAAMDLAARLAHHAP